MHSNLIESFCFYVLPLLICQCCFHSFFFCPKWHIRIELSNMYKWMRTNFLHFFSNTLVLHSYSLSKWAFCQLLIMVMTIWYRWHISNHLRTKAKAKATSIFGHNIAMSSCLCWWSTNTGMRDKHHVICSQTHHSLSEDKTNTFLAI